MPTTKERTRKTSAAEARFMGLLVERMLSTGKWIRIVGLRASHEEWLDRFELATGMRLRSKVITPPDDAGVVFGHNTAGDIMVTTVRRIPSDDDLPGAVVYAIALPRKPA